MDGETKERKRKKLAVIFDYLFGKVMIFIEVGGKIKPP